MVDSLITGGTVVMPSEAAAVDIGVQDGRVVAIGVPGDDAAPAVDATGHIWGYSATLGLYLCWERGDQHNIGSADEARQAAEVELAVARDALATARDELAVAQVALATARDELAVAQVALATALAREQNALARERNAWELLAAAEETIRRLRARLGDGDSRDSNSDSESQNDAATSDGAGQEG